MPTLVLNETFEGGSLAAYTIVGAASVDTTSKLEGSNSLLMTGAGANNILNTPPASQTAAVYRFTVKMPTGGTPTGTLPTLLNVRTLFGTNMQIRLSTAGVLQAIITGGSLVAGPTLTVDTEYKVDVSVSCLNALHTLDWKVDGAAKTQAVSTLAAGSTLDQEKLGNINAGTTAVTVYLDSWAISRTPADFPIGTYGFGYSQAASASVSTSASIVRRTGSVRSAAATCVATTARFIRAGKTTSITLTPTAAKRSSFVKTASTTVSASAGRALPRTLTASVSTAAGLSRRLSARRTLTPTVTVSASVSAVTHILGLVVIAGQLVVSGLSAIALRMRGTPDATRPGVDATYLRNFPRTRNGFGRRRNL